MKPSQTVLGQPVPAPLVGIDLLHVEPWQWIGPLALVLAGPGAGGLSVALAVEAAVEDSFGGPSVVADRAPGAAMRGNGSDRTV